MGWGAPWATSLLDSSEGMVGAGRETVYRSGGLGRTSFRQADPWDHGPKQGFIQKCHTGCLQGT